jgi:hypothetical protein
MRILWSRTAFLRLCLRARVAYVLKWALTCDLLRRRYCLFKSMCRICPYIGTEKLACMLARAHSHKAYLRTYETHSQCLFKDICDNAGPRAFSQTDSTYTMYTLYILYMYYVYYICTICTICTIYTIYTRYTIYSIYSIYTIYTIYYIYYICYICVYLLYTIYTVFSETTSCSKLCPSSAPMAFPPPPSFFYVC